MARDGQDLRPGRERLGQAACVGKDLDKVEPGRYDGSVPPGGRSDRHEFRLGPEALRNVLTFRDVGKPVATIRQGSAGTRRASVKE